jgi:hypothetical protein
VEMVAQYLAVMEAQMAEMPTAVMAVTRTAGRQHVRLTPALTHHIHN